MSVYIRKIADHAGQEARVCGWLYNKRSSGKLIFLLVRDGTGIIQATVFKPGVAEEIWNIANSLTQESSVIVTGTVAEDKRAPGGYELQVKSLELVGESVDYPITPKEHGIEYLLDRRHLWLRSKRQHAVLRVRHHLIKAIRDYLDSRDFIMFDAPMFTPNAVEGTTSLFETDYFGSKAYLTQSGQLYQEAGCMAFGRTYCFGPTFRAEKSKTRRHLTEFWMIEPEVAYLDLEGNMDLIEDFLVDIIARILEVCAEDLKILERDTSSLETVVKPFPRITYDEAARILTERETGFQYGSDLGGNDETVLADHFSKPVMVHRWPAEVKAFYMKRDPEDQLKALGVDVLAPEGHGEIVGGGQREDDVHELIKRIREHDLPQEYFEWYLDLRRYGSVPHSGFGLGLERTVGWICGLKHIREAIPFPRMMYRLQP